MPWLPAAPEAAPDLTHELYTGAVELEDGTILNLLLTVWSDGKREIASREHPWHRWSPPITLQPTETHPDDLPGLPC